MSSRHLLNPAVRDPSKVQVPGDPAQQLSHALTSLSQSYPPQNSYSSHECHGLYSGPTSIAYLFLHLSRTHPKLKVSGHGPMHWAKAYLAGKHSAGSVTASKNGVINEELAFYAVRAALTQDLQDVRSLVKSIKNGVLTAEQGSDEWLYGRAGCLYLLRLVRSWVKETDDIVTPIIEDLIQLILSHGPSWPWHGKDYLGKWFTESCVSHVAPAIPVSRGLPRLTMHLSRRCSRAHRYHHPGNIVRPIQSDVTRSSRQP